VSTSRTPEGQTVLLRKNVIAGAGVGILAGFLSGVFGVGGGILIVPGLVLLMRMRQRLAHGTSLAAIVLIAISGMLGYALDHAVDWSAGGLLIIGAIAGAVAGTRALKSIRDDVLRVAFAVFLLATAVRLLVSTPEATGRGPIEVWLALGLVGIGLAAGALAGLLGVGGGIVIIPALVVLFSVPDAVAKGTSLFVIIPTALAGTMQNLRNNNVAVDVAVAVGVVGAGVAYAGSKLAVNMSAHLSSILFSGLLFAVAAQMLLAGRRGARDGDGRRDA
jgi:uncharacterized membrane protein YfcA